MAKQYLVITGIPPYDGEYPIEDNGFTQKEYHFIKQVSGVRAGELQEAMAAGDVAVGVALTAITLERNGKTVHLPVLWEAKEEASNVVAKCSQCGFNNEFTEAGKMPEVCGGCRAKLADQDTEDSDRPLDTATSGGQTSEPVAGASESAS